MKTINEVQTAKDIEDISTNRNQPSPKFVSHFMFNAPQEIA